MIDEIIKHIADLEHRIIGDALELYVVRDQLGALAEIVGDIAIEVKEMKRRGNYDSGNL